MKLLTFLTPFILAGTTVLAAALPQVADIYVPVLVYDDAPANMTKRQDIGHDPYSEIQMFTSTDCSASTTWSSRSRFARDVPTQWGMRSFRTSTEVDEGCFIAYAKFDWATKKCTGHMYGQVFKNWCQPIFRLDGSTIDCFRFSWLRAECATNHP